MTIYTNRACIIDMSPKKLKPKMKSKDRNPNSGDYALRVTLKPHQLDRLVDLCEYYGSSRNAIIRMLIMSVKMDDILSHTFTDDYKSDNDEDYLE